jgi:hypothetical protein
MLHSSVYERAAADNAPHFYDPAGDTIPIICRPDQVSAGAEWAAGRSVFSVVGYSCSNDNRGTSIFRVLGEILPKHEPDPRWRLCRVFLLHRTERD